MSENKTPFAGLNQWEGNEYPKRVDFVNDNEKIDTALKTLDETKAGAGELGDLVDVITDGLAGISTELGDVGNIVTQVDTKVTDVQSKIGNPGDTSPNTLFGVTKSSMGAGFRVQIYSTPGNHTFLVPSGIHQIFVSACGAGGGGGGGGGGNNTFGGGGGGGGTPLIRRPYTVVPSTTLRLTVGTGGSGGIAGVPGVAMATSGSSGTATVVHGYITLLGGRGGGGGGDQTPANSVNHGFGGVAGGVGAGDGGNGNRQGSTGMPGKKGIISTGGGSGNGGGGGGGGYGGGGGGGTRYSTNPSLGGVGGFLITSHGEYVLIQNGGIGGFGGGGGGGSGSANSTGGKGGDGVVIIEY